MKEEKNKKQEENGLLKVIKTIAPYIIIFLIVMFIRTFIIAPVQVYGRSMDSTLKSGDVMILNRLQYKRYGVKRFDIIVIEYLDTHIIKRAIGLPGDIVEMKDNVLYINNKKYEEYYLDKGTTTEDFLVAVPEDHYFVLGDNREDSHDSRQMGFIDEENINGIASITIYPFNRIGIKK